MKLYIGLFLLEFSCFTACNQHQAGGNALSHQKSKQMQELSAFNNWLTSHNISSKYFNDTIASKADSLWTYAFPLMRSDSLYKWYPSTDSSYYLLSNMDWTNRQSIFKKHDDIEYRFLNTKSKAVFIGITLLQEGPLAPVDIFWHDSSTIYLLEMDKMNKDYELVKLRIPVDTIWSYRAGKNER